MSIRVYHQTSRRGGVSYGPGTALLVFPFYIGWLLVVLMFWTAYAAFWALGWIVSVAALAIASRNRDSAWADELGAFVAAPSIRAWLAGRAIRARRRAARTHTDRDERPTEPLPQSAISDRR